MAFTIARVYTGEDDESYFEDVTLSLEDAGEIGRLSALQPAEGVIFRENEPSYDFDWHHAPRRQYVVLLDGHIELEVSSGEKREFRGGDILLVEDTHGKGHRTRTVNDKPRRSLFIPLE